MKQLVFSSREDAENVLEALRRLRNEYGVATVADLLEMSGELTVYSDEKIGWTELGDVPIGRTKDAGYILDLPEPKSIVSPPSAFPFLKGWWLVVDVPDEQTYEGTLVDEMGGSMILETARGTRFAIAMSGINKIDAYRERPTN